MYFFTLNFDFDDFNVYCEISVSLGLVQNLEILEFAVTKVEKIKIAVTYSSIINCDCRSSDT